jgi:putative redox protein
MIRASSDGDSHQTAFSNGTYSSIADTPREKGGKGGGFGPHELIEAALATCMTISVRKQAAKAGIPLAGVRVEVRIDRSIPGEVTLKHWLTFDGRLHDEHVQQLREAASNCAVGRTLTGKIKLMPATQSE